MKVMRVIFDFIKCSDEPRGIQISSNVILILSWDSVMSFVAVHLLSLFWKLQVQGEI